MKMVEDCCCIDPSPSAPLYPGDWKCMSCGNRYVPKTQETIGDDHFIRITVVAGAITLVALVVYLWATKVMLWP